jgi:hypothetical protein
VAAAARRWGVIVCFVLLLFRWRVNRNARAVDLDGGRAAIHGATL